MIERTEERFGIKPAYLAADTAYGSADTLDWVVNETTNQSARMAPSRGKTSGLTRNGTFISAQPAKC
jgi:hypothetical protein